MPKQPFTSFEKDELDPQPDLAFGAKRQKLDQEHLEQQNETENSESKEIRDQLELIEFIQQISGTKPLGHKATMEDWDDRSTVEVEIVAMMRHFGMMSMAHGRLDPPSEDTLNKSKDSPKIHIMRQGNHMVPLILDPKYFEPRRQPSSNLNSVYCDPGTGRGG